MIQSLTIFLGIAIAAFVGMELLSYVLHRWVFHGLLWKLHLTHHEKRHGTFEANDLFAFVFTLFAIILLIFGLGDPLGSIAFPTGLGMTVYGILYFFVHDLVTHKRFYPMTSKIGWIDVVRRAHLRHHQSVEKDGHEPYGLFLMPTSLWAELREGRRRQHDESPVNQNR